MFQIYSRCAICKLSRYSCREFGNNKCSGFEVNDQEVDYYRPKNTCKTVRELTSILGVSEKAVRNCIIKCGLKDYPNYEEKVRQGRTSCTYSLEELLDGLIELKMDIRAVAIKKYLDNESFLFNSYIDSLIKSEIKKVKCSKNTGFEDELIVYGLPYHVFNETETTYIVMNEKRELKAYDKELFKCCIREV